MDRKSAARARIESITELAERQHGVIATAQLYSLGLSQTQVATRARNGWLHRLHRGVYAVGHRRVSRHGLWMADVLACGEGAVLSHGAAGVLWKLSQSTEGATSRLNVTIPSQRGVLVRPGLIVHRVPSLRLEETTRHEGVPVTTPTRTLLDLALELPRRELERAIDEAERLRLCRQADLEAIIVAHFGRAGAGALRRVLETFRIGTTLTRSELEERFLALCRRHRLPGPGVNVPLLDYVVDFLWPEARLIVEVDGRATHGTRRAFQADRDSRSPWQATACCASPGGM